MRLLLMIGIFIQLSAAPSLARDNVAHGNSSPQNESPQLHLEILRVSSELQEPADSAQDLARRLERAYQEIVTVDLNQFDLKDIRHHAGPMIQMLFNSRLHLQEKVAEWQEKGWMTQRVQTAKHDLDRLARYMGEMIGEIKYFAPESEPTNLIGFEGGFPNTMTPTEAQPKFRSGDVILFRGSRHNSAAIARIGNVNSMFSHVGIVYWNEEKQKFQLVESLIESGVVVNDLKKTLDYNLSRMTLLRFKGSDKIAHQAAKAIYKKATNHVEKTGETIPYDFSMRMSNYNAMFCSKVVRYAFDEATNGQTMIPAFPSVMRMDNDDFFHRIGVKAEHTFAPGDMLIDPRFRVVADWANYTRTSDSRLKDLVMDKIFQWMEQDGLQFEEDWKMSALGKSVKAISEVPGLSKIVAKAVGPIPDYMTPKIISTMVMLHLTAEPLFQHLKTLDAEKRIETGYPLHPLEAYSALEEELARANGDFKYLK